MGKLIDKIKRMILKTKSNFAVVKYYKKVELVPTVFKELFGDQLTYVERIGEFELHYILGNICFNYSLANGHKIDTDSWEGKCYLAEIHGLAKDVLKYYQITRMTEDKYFENRTNHNWDSLDSNKVTAERIEIAISIMGDYKFQYNRSFSLFSKELALDELITEIEHILEWNK